MKYKMLLTLVLATFCSHALLCRVWASQEAANLVDTMPSIEETFVEEPFAADGVEEGISIDAASFPDSRFRSYVASEAVDTDGDSILSRSERDGIVFMDCAGMGIADLTGIGLFPGLQYLYCDENSLTSLDVSGNAALVDLDCSGNALTELNVSGCTGLESLYCEDNALASLDVSACGGLGVLWCHGNDLTLLDLSKNLFLSARLAESGLVEQDGEDIWKDGATYLRYDTGLRILSAGGIPVNAGNFPDDTLRMLLRDGYDYDGNGFLTEEDVAGVTRLDCSGLDIADLTGIGLFPNLAELICGPAVMELDLRECPGPEKTVLEGDLTELDGLRVFWRATGLVQVQAGTVIWVNGPDADLDGDTDRADALAVLRHAVGLEVLSEGGQTSADTVRDGTIDARDAARILNIAMRLGCE